MALIFQIVLVVHVLFAALWFGGAAFLPRALRESLTYERSSARLRIAALMRQGKVLVIAGAVTVAAGIALSLLRPGGFGGLPVRFHVSLLLSLVWLGLGVFVTRPTALRIATIVKSDDPLAPAQALVKRVSAVVGAQHLLFTVVLVLMLWRL